MRSSENHKRGSSPGSMGSIRRSSMRRWAFVGLVSAVIGANVPEPVGALDDYPMYDGFFVGDEILITPVTRAERAAMKEVDTALGLFGSKVDDERIRKALVAANEKASGMKPEEFLALDTRWRGGKDVDAIVKSVLEAECSEVLRSFRTTFRDFVMILVTDAVGVAVCATDRPPAYLFSGRSWWKKTFLDPGSESWAGSEGVKQPRTGEHRAAVFAPVVDPDTGAKLGVGVAIVKAGFD